MRTSIRSTRTAGLVAAAALALVPAVAEAGTGGTSPTGAPASNPAATVPGSKAKLVNGAAVAPKRAPAKVKRVIAAANKIRTKPYVYGGGHGNWNDKGYDCSGAVSFALHGGKLLKAPLDSSGLAKWEEPGKGSWISVYGNPGTLTWSLPDSGSTPRTRAETGLAGARACARPPASSPCVIPRASRRRAPDQGFERPPPGGRSPFWDRYRLPSDFPIR